MVTAMSAVWIALYHMHSIQWFFKTVMVGRGVINPFLPSYLYISVKWMKNEICNSSKLHLIPVEHMTPQPQNHFLYVM